MLNLLLFLQINVRYKLVSGSPSGVVAAECKQAQASWVVLDKYGQLLNQ